MKLFESRKKWFILAGFIVFILSCAKTPIVNVKRPWVRILSSDIPIKPDSKVKINVYKTDGILLGDDKLLNNKIKKIVSSDLEKRGFKITTQDDYVYLLTIKYKTQMYNQFEMSSYTSVSYDRFDVTSSSNSNSQVLLSAILSAFANETEINQETKLKSKKNYMHIISLEIAGRDNNVLWKGESTWDTPNIDLFPQINTAIKLIVSNLPRDENKLQEIKLLKKDKIEMYFMLECANKHFSCPALPYWISFPKNTSGVTVSTNQEYDDFYYLIKNKVIEDTYALPAYVDLLSNAEYALPVGEKDYSKPLDKDLWSKVILGGRYIYKDKKINVLIKLVGNGFQYMIKKCQVVSDDEYSKFKQKLNKWNSALKDYFNMYKE